MSCKMTVLKEKYLTYRQLEVSRQEDFPCEMWGIFSKAEQELYRKIREFNSSSNNNNKEFEGQHPIQLLFFDDTKLFLNYC